MAALTALLADDRGTVFVKYSSLALLVAIAALAVLGETGGRFLD